MKLEADLFESIMENIQRKVFKILGLSEKESNDQFGFLINSFKYGAPPHGGIAIGFDRLVAILNGNESIRDFIAFQKIIKVKTLC